MEGRRGGFSQLCCDRCWKRVMAASCSGTVVGSSGDHVRDVALDVAGRKVDDENDIHTFKRPDYTAEEWRWLFMTTGSDYYFNSSWPVKPLVQRPGGLTNVRPGFGETDSIAT